MIKVTGGIETFFPTIRLFDASFINGNSPAPDKIFTSSSGYVQYEQQGCTEGHVGAGSINSGQIFPGFRGLLDLTPTPPDVINGGFSYQRGSIVDVIGPYTLTIFDETIVVISGTAGDINLPPAANMRGKIYNIKNEDPSSTTVIPDGLDTIDGASSFAIPPSGGSVTLQSNGVSNWVVL
jgi:hypothetical protein